MDIKTLAASAALSLLVVGGTAVAQTNTSTQIGPSQPIPYGQLKAYQKASPKMRASKDWSAPSADASTGVATDTSATTGMQMPMPAPGETTTGPARMDGSMDPSMSPPATTTPDMRSEPGTTMTPPTMPEAATTPEPGSNLPGGSPMSPPKSPQ